MDFLCRLLNMSKSKSKGSEAGAKSETDVLTKTKDMGVIKPSQTSKSRSTDLSQKVVEKQQGSQKQKKIKEETPDSSDSSDSEEDSADDVSDSEIEGQKKGKKVTKTNGVAKVKITPSDETEDSEVDSDEDSPSSASSDEGKVIRILGPKAAFSKWARDAFEKLGGTDSDKDITDSSEDEKPKAVKGAGPLKESVSSAAGLKHSSDTDSDEESDRDLESSNAESEESETDEKETETKPFQKRKAIEEAGRSEPKKAKKEIEDNVTTSPNLFVGQLSWNVDDEWLQREFEEFGELVGARVITDKQSGRSKGYVSFNLPTCVN